MRQSRERHTHTHTHTRKRARVTESRNKGIAAKAHLGCQGLHFAHLKTTSGPNRNVLIPRWISRSAQNKKHPLASERLLGLRLPRRTSNRRAFVGASHLKKLSGEGPRVWRSDLPVGSMSLAGECGGGGGSYLLTYLGSQVWLGRTRNLHCERIPHPLS